MTVRDQFKCPRCHQEIAAPWHEPTKRDSREGHIFRRHTDDLGVCPTGGMIVEHAERWVRETRERLGLPA